MSEQKPGIFISNLKWVLSNDPLREKWLIAPTNRIGFQWLDRVARLGQPVLNTRVKTVRALALEIASPLMDKRGLTFVNAERARFIVAGLLWRSMDAEGSYFGGLEKSWKLVQIIYRALADMRGAGLASRSLELSSFEVEGKGRELTRLLGGYEEALAEGHLIDYASVLELVIDGMTSGSLNLPEGLLAIVPGDLIRKLSGLEAWFLELLVDRCGTVIGLQESPDHVAEDPTDARLLRFALDPPEAPEPRGDGTATIFRAVGEINEVRGVFRRCVRDGVPLDDVELLYTDPGTYLTMIFDTVMVMAGGDFAKVPATFYEGVPVMCTRPGRALYAFITWTVENCRQEAAARMIQEGLIRFEGLDERFQRLAAMFRTLPIGEGLDRYAALEKKAEQPDGRTDGQEARDWLALYDTLKKLTCAAEKLLTGGTGPLKASLDFLNDTARPADQLDEYGRAALVREISALLETGGEAGGLEAVDLTEWLIELLGKTSVEGKGPRPGCIYAAPLHAGGHSGRTHTFIIGLDDTRFPGHGIQDPVLLDSERTALSPGLKHAGERPTEQMEQFAEVLSRLPGDVGIGYCCRKLDDDRRLFPGPAVLAAYRVISGDHEGELDDLERWLGEPVYFAPASVEECINGTDYRLYLVGRDAALSDPEILVASVFPHLGRGFTARDARAGERFTEYDGYVPEAGKDWVLTAGEKTPVSPTRLETLGKNPMEYFFRYVLDVEVPEAYEIDSSRWLDPMETGSLLHEVFREFVQLLIDEGSAPDYGRDCSRLQHILWQNIEVLRGEKPPQRMDVFRREAAELERACEIFLKEEEAYSGRSRPACCEASIGLPPEGEGTRLDCDEPVAVELPGGRTIYVRGRIDRIDELAGGTGEYAVFDYKTGSDYSYDEADPHRQGRLIQNSLYMELADRRLKSEIGAGARAALFGYFFPNTRAHGERYEWTREELAPGLEYVELLSEMLEQGCFVFSDDANDARFSDYAEAFGDTEASAADTKRKMQNPENDALETFRKLRE